MPGTTMNEPPTTESAPPRDGSLASRLTPARIVAFAILGSIPVKLLRERLVDPDLWWHMRTGQLVVEDGLPRTDPFSYTAAGREWIVQGWASDVFLHQLRDWFGLWGPLLFRAVALLVIYALVARMLVRRMGGGIGTWALLGLIAYAGAPNWTERPNLLSFILFVVTLRLVDRGDARIWWFVPIAALWANLHGMVILGIGLVGLVAFMETIKAVLGWAGGSADHAKRLWLVTGASILAMMVNPVGPKLIRHTIQLVGIAQGIAQEWQSPNFHEPGPVLFLCLVLVAITTLAFRRTKPDATDLILMFAFLAMALQAQRNLLPAAIVIGTRVATWITDLRETNERPATGKAVGQGTASVLNVAAVTVTAAALLIVLADGLPRSSARAALIDRAYPLEMIERANIPGARVFAHDFWSGMVIDRTWPNTRIFVDLRWDFYGRAIADQYSEVITAKTTAKGILDRTCTTHVLVPSGDPISQLLRSSQGWEIIGGEDPRDVDADRKAVLFARTVMPPSCPPAIPRA